MLKFGDLCSNSSKTYVRFEISTFGIGYRKNFFKIKKLILFDLKRQHLGIQTQNFPKTKVRFEISTFKIGYMRNFIKRLDKWYFLVQNTQIWVFGLEVWKTKASRRLQTADCNFDILGCFGSFCNFLGVVLAGFG